MWRSRKIRVFLTVLVFCIMSVFPARAGQYLSTATPMSIGGTVNGSLSSSHEEYYQFSISSNSIVQFKATTGGHNQHLYIELYSSTGATLCSYWTDDNYNWGFQSATRTVALQAGKYFVGVSKSYSNNSTSYTLQSSFLKKQSGGVIVGSAYSNHYLSTAQPFTLGNTLNSVAETTIQYYKFSLPSSAMIRLKGTTATEGLYAYVCLYDSNGKRIETVMTLKYDTAPVYTKTLAQGTYFLGIETYSSSARGQFQLSTTNLSGSVKNGLKMENGKLIYYKNGVVDSSYTGLTWYNSKWYYLEKGRFSAKTGITRRADGKSGWFYVENGLYNNTRTGITRRVDGKGGWYYVEKGRYRTDRTGIVRKVNQSNGWYYIENGVYKYGKTGITRRANGKGGWYYVENGVYRPDRTGIVRKMNQKTGWYYILKGVYQSSKTGICRRADGKGGWHYVKNGVYQSTFTGWIYDKSYRDYYYIVNGVMQY